MNARCAFGFVSLLTLAACGGGRPAPPPPATGGPAATIGAAEFGVPECDEYIKKYLACIDSKVPEASRAQVRLGVEQMKTAWKQAAATPEGKAALATGCQQATIAAKSVVQAYGCTW